MLRNFISDLDLKRYAPNIGGQMYSDQVSYQPQIDKAFDLILNDFQKAGYDSRLCMSVLDLNNINYKENDIIVSVTKTVDFTGDSFKMGNRRRLVVDVISVVTDSSYWTMKLQGSNKIIPIEADWEDIPDSVNTIKIMGHYTIVLQSKWNYIRLKLLKNLADSITFTAFVVETVFDDMICLRALMLMLADWRKSPDDEWDFKYKDLREQYDAEFNKIRFYYDSNKNGWADESETETIGDIRFMR